MQFFLRLSWLLTTVRYISVKPRIFWFLGIDMQKSFEWLFSLLKINSSEHQSWRLDCVKIQFRSWNRDWFSRIYNSFHFHLFHSWTNLSEKTINNRIPECIKWFSLVRLLSVKDNSVQILAIDGATGKNMSIIRNIDKFLNIWGHKNFLKPMMKLSI